MRSTWREREIPGGGGEGVGGGSSNAELDKCMNEVIC